MRGTKPMAITFMVIALLLPVFTSAQYTLTGVFQSSSNDHQLHQTDSWPEFEAKQKQLKDQGYCIDDIEVTGNTRQKAYWATFKKSELTRITHRVNEWSDLLDKNKSLSDKGWSLVDIEASPFEQDKLEYLGIWEKMPPESYKTQQQLWKLSSMRSVLLLTKQMEEKKQYIQDIEFIGNASQANYLLQYQEGFIDERTHIVVHITPTSFAEDRLERFKSGYRLIDFERFDAAGKSFFVGIFKKGNGPESLRANLDPSSFDDFSKTVNKDGLAITDLEVMKEPLNAVPAKPSKAQSASLTKQ